VSANRSFKSSFILVSPVFSTRLLFAFLRSVTVVCFAGCSPAAARSGGGWGRGAPWRALPDSRRLAARGESIFDPTCQFVYGWSGELPRTCASRWNSSGGMIASSPPLPCHYLIWWTSPVRAIRSSHNSIVLGSRFWLVRHWLVPDLSGEGVVGKEYPELVQILAERRVLAGKPALWRLRVCCDRCRPPSAPPTTSALFFRNFGLYPYTTRTSGTFVLTYSNANPCAIQ
jgi:hypothetical protein